MKQILIAVVTLIFLFPKNILAQTAAIELVNGMKINASTTILRADYNLDAASNLDSAIVIIEGKNIVVDFSNALIHSKVNVVTPDQFRGVVLLVRNSEYVTIKNARIHGYKIAVRAENVKHLTIENCDFSYNYRKYLNSTQEREDLSDWMSYHNNEHNEWLHYGASIYLSGCDDAIIRNNKSTNGQCALMMTDCNFCKVQYNNFSFNSGIGVGLYRSNFNEVMYNQLDFNIRGYSFGYYNRGQDAAGMLVYEQSNGNIFAYNSATHCGDGFSLWSGNSTMNSGVGGSNNNLIFGNDFSDASNNGVEATFSKNNIIYNRIERCDYGIWGGYSYYTLMGLNQFADNNTAVAIEHGQHNQLLMNTFSGDQLGVKIWANPNQSAQWEYPKFRDTRSTNYWIENNLFKGNNMVIDITNSDSIEINNNEFADAVEIYKPDFKSRMINFGADGIKLKPEDFSKFKKAFEPDATAEIPAVNVFAGRENMIVTNWGPYDFQRPLLKMMSADTSKIYFKVYGPLGKWRVKRWKGVTDFSRTTGLRNDTFSAKIIHHAENAPTDILLELEYVGTAVVDEFGNEIPERNSVLFSYQKYELPIGWKVNYYKMDTFNPAKYPGVFKNAIKLGVKKTESVNKLEYSWNGAPDSKLNDDHFALVATATQNFVKGNYSFGITADDGVRFYVDDKLVMDEWDATKYRFNDELHHEVTLPLEGIHQLKVEYYDQTGFATLMMTVQKL